VCGFAQFCSYPHFMQGAWLIFPALLNVTTVLEESGAIARIYIALGTGQHDQEQLQRVKWRCCVTARVARAMLRNESLFANGPSEDPREGRRNDSVRKRESLKSDTA